MNTSHPVVSIIVPACNEAATIEACLEGLRHQDYPADRLEIVVVDGLSSDDTADRVRRVGRSDPRVRLITNQGRITPLAFNLGIRAARGDIIGVISAHAVPESSCVRRGVDALQSTGAWCVGGSIKRVGGTPTQRAISAATSSPFGVGNAAHNYATDARWVETAFPGMWPRWVFEKVGLFDPELVRNQDDELSFRIREAGGRIWYDPGIVVEYTPRGSFGGLFSQYRQYGMWKVRVFQKHPRAARARHLVPAAWVASMTGGILLAPVTPIAPVLTVASAGAYGAVMAAALARVDRRGASRMSVLQALVTLHLAYGIGFWQGIVRFAPRWVLDRKGGAERLGRREPA